MGHFESGMFRDRRFSMCVDGITLGTYGLTQVGQLWGKEDIMGRISNHMEAQYHKDMRINFSCWSLNAIT